MTHKVINIINQCILNATKCRIDANRNKVIYLYTHYCSSHRKMLMKYEIKTFKLLTLDFDDKNW